MTLPVFDLQVTMIRPIKFQVNWPSLQKSTTLLTWFRRENAGVVGDKPVKNDAGEMSMSKDSKQKAWLEHFQRLLKVEFDWDPDHLSDKPPVEGPPVPITIYRVKKAIGKVPSDWEHCFIVCLYKERGN